MTDTSSRDHDLLERFVDAVEYLNRQLHRANLKEWESMDMTIPQVKALVLLEGVGPMRMGAIASHLGSTLSASTNIIDRLVEKGLVERHSDSHDRRVVVCKSTDRGRQAVDQFWRIGRERILPIAEAMDPQQLAGAVRVLEGLRDTIERVRAPLAAPGSDR